MWDWFKGKIKKLIGWDSIKAQLSSLTAPSTQTSPATPEEPAKENGAETAPGNARTGVPSSPKTEDEAKEKSAGFLGGLGNIFGGTLGAVVGIVLFLVKGLLSLFGVDFNTSFLDSPGGNVIQKTANLVETKAAEVVSKGKELVQKGVGWVKEKLGIGKVDDIDGARGIRNNNPGNIIADPVNNWVGQKGSDGKFVVFDTVAHGLRAMDRNLLSYADKFQKANGKLISVHDIIDKWAPATDGNNVSAYAASVSRAMNISPDQGINLHDSKTLMALTRAMVEVENGKGKVPYPEASYAWGANAALNKSDMAYNSGKSPVLVKQNGQYVMKDVQDGSSLTAGNTPAAGTGKKPAMLPSYGV